MRFDKILENEKITVYNVIETPYSYVVNKELKKEFLAVGNEMIMDVPSKEEAEKLIEAKPWILLTPTIGAIIDRILEIKKIEENGNNSQH